MPIQTFLCRGVLHALLGHVSRLGGVEGRDEIVGGLSVEAERVSQALQFGGFFEIRLLEPISASMEVLFNCVKADV